MFYPGLPIFLKYLSSLFIDLRIMKKTGKNTLLKLEGLKNLAQQDELRTGYLNQMFLLVSSFYVLFLFCVTQTMQKRESFEKCIGNSTI
jgi:hypothetical protein